MNRKRKCDVTLPWYLRTNFSVLSNDGRCMAYHIAPDCNHAQESHTCYFFFHFSLFQEEESEGEPSEGTVTHIVFQISHVLNELTAHCRLRELTYMASICRSHNCVKQPSLGPVTRSIRLIGVSKFTCVYESTSSQTLLVT